MAATESPRSIRVYSIALLLGIIGGMISNGILSAVSAQDDSGAEAEEKPDEQPEMEEVIRAQRIELVTPNGKPLILMGTHADGSQSHTAYLKIGSDSPRNGEWEGLRMEYIWSDDQEDGMYDRFKEGAIVEFHTSTNYRGAEFSLLPGHLSLSTTDRLTEKGEEYGRRWMQLNPGHLRLGTNSDVQASISTSWNGDSVFQLDRGDTISGTDRRSARIEVLGDNDEPPRLVLSNAEGKPVATVPPQKRDDDD